MRSFVGCCLRRRGCDHGRHSPGARQSAPHSDERGGTFTLTIPAPPPSSECRPDQARSQKCRASRGSRERRNRRGSSPRLRGAGPHSDECGVSFTDEAGPTAFASKPAPTGFASVANHRVAAIPVGAVRGREGLGRTRTNALCHPPTLLLTHRIRQQAHRFCVRRESSSRRNTCRNSPRLRGAGPYSDERGRSSTLYVTDPPPPRTSAPAFCLP
jgi:hypothetical protein